MISSRNNRLDPSRISSRQLKELASAFAKPGQAALALIDEAGHRTAIPGALLQQLARLVRLIAEKRTVVLIAEDETFSTQACADYLGMSRQHFVDLLERKRIPFHKVGTHRRVTFKDLLAFETRRDKERHAALDRLSKRVDSAGVYDSDYMGDG